MNYSIQNILLSFILLFTFSNYSLQNEDKKEVIIAQSILKSNQYPEWTKNLSIYEVNIRQYTKEGTFKAFMPHLSRIKKLGTNIIWLMPIHPIGQKNRKGKLGSYYAVQDYKAVNPEFGTMEDFKALVAKAHKLGMYVIIDWVPNHTAWDNTMAKTNPEWFEKGEDGNFTPPKGTDWTDVIQLDYSQKGLRKYMIEAFKFWLKEADIDGFRCDVAGKVPTDFWNEARVELDKVKSVFMLAEWESVELHEKAFDMTYGWTLYDRLHKVCLQKEGMNANTLRTYFKKELKNYPNSAYRMLFVDNHDKNSWDGTMFSQFGKGLETAIALTCVAKGMPLVYTGQEAGLDKQLKFFEKDEFTWKKHEVGKLYQKLLKLKKKNEALWNGNFGGEMILTKNTNSQEVFSFLRKKEDKKIFAIFNFSDKIQTVKISSKEAFDSYKNYFSNKKTAIDKNSEIKLEAWAYYILVK